VRLLLGCWLLWTSACFETRTNLVSDPDAAVRVPPGAGHEAVAGAAADAQTQAAAHVASARCGTRPCACDDGLDNDADGLIDGLDPECTGSFDDDEATFGIGKPNKHGQCLDCFWDDNAGSGDDGCRYPVECLSGAAPKNNGNCSSCQVSSSCQNYCLARTPNGCDCFGCCAVATPGGNQLFIELSEGCGLDRLDDTKACPRCIQNTACANPCGRCELCLGKRLSDLPSDCAAASPNGPAHACDERQAACTLSSDCAGAAYCQLGCCLVDLL
jgi:hypothetical protein